MAQKSKKEHIIQTALPLFLQQGFKGTSVDLVVKECGVSKPTVYNHFPDKAALLFAIVETLLDRPIPDLDEINHQQQLEQAIDNLWLSQNNVQFYALVIGEGRRFPEAKQLFWNFFDKSWREAILAACRLQQNEVELTMDHRLLNRLRNL